MTPSGAREEPVWTLEAIAQTLAISLRTLKRLLTRPAGERPPIRHCHRGYYAYRSRLQAWVDVEDLDAGLHLELLALRRAAPKGGAAGEDDQAA